MGLQFCVYITVVSLAMICTGCRDSGVQRAREAVSAASQRAAVSNLPPIDLTRRFFIAFFTQDEESLKDLCLPHPELHVMWGGERLPPDYLEVVKRMIATSPAKIVKPGDMFMIGGKVFEMQAYDATVYCPVNFEFWPVFPIPCHREREGDRWRIDAGAWIAARKGAARARRLAQVGYLPPVL